MATRLSFFSRLTDLAARYKVEQFSVFVYKMLAWLFLGIVIGVTIALTQGFMPIWVIAVHIIGSIGLGWVFAFLFIEYTKSKRSFMIDNGHRKPENATVPARVDSVYSGGLRMLEQYNQMVINITVFPHAGTPYQTTIKQYMTEEEIDQLDLDNPVTFYENPQDPGYGTLALQSPDDGLPADFETFEATKGYPYRKKTGLWLLIGRNPTLRARSISSVLILVLFTTGFLLPYQVSGNVDWLWLRIKYFPQKLTFSYKGNYNAEAFRKSYDKARGFIGKQRIQSILFYRDNTVVTFEPADNPGYLARVIINGNSVGREFLKMQISDHEEAQMFTIASAPYEVLKKALDHTATQHDLEDIGYIGFRKDTRWGTRDGCVRPDFSQTYVDVHVTFKGGLFSEYVQSLHYKGDTAELLPR